MYLSKFKPDTVSSGRNQPIQAYTMSLHWLCVNQTQGIAIVLLFLLQLYKFVPIMNSCCRLHALDF